MKKWIMTGAVVIVFALVLFFGYSVVATEKGQVCLAKHSDNLVGCMLAGPVALTVQVVGQVDQVLIYRADDEAKPVVTINTQGQTLTQTVQLPTQYQYYLVTAKGDQRARGRTIGFDTNLATATVTIRGLGQYEGW